MKTISTKQTLKPFLILGAGAALILGTKTVQAQIGSNWQQFSPDSYIQIEVNDVYKSYPANSTVVNDGGVRYTNKNGIETFKLVSTQSNRAERRYYDNYSDRRQFEGYVMVSGPTDDEKIHQIFCADPDGPYVLLNTHASSGSISVNGGGGGTLISGCYGTWVRINSIHDKAANLTDIYCNGSLKSHSGWGSGNSYYTKYGCYGSLQTSYAMVQYKNVKMFETGSGGGFSGWYQINDRNSGKDAAVHYAATTNGATVILWTFGSAQNDEWELTPTDSGYYKIVNRHSGKVMAVQGASTSQGAPVIQWSYGSAQNDQWKPVDVGGGYYKFVNRHSGLVLDVTGANTSNGTPFEQWGDNGGNNQQFQLISTP